MLIKFRSGTASDASAAGDTHSLYSALDSSDELKETDSPAHQVRKATPLKSGHRVGLVSTEYFG